MTTDQVTALIPKVAQAPVGQAPVGQAPRAPRLIGERSPFGARVENGPVALDAVVRGKLPPWLRGALVRTAPAVFDRVGWHAQHWFDGLGVLYAFRIDAGGVRFQQRLMASEVARASSEGRTPRGSFGTPIVRSFWRRLFSPTPVITDNTNVNALAFGDEYVALTESPHQWVFDPATLELQHPVKYEDRLGDLNMSAHPHFDFERNRVVNAALELGGRSSLIVYEHDPRSRTRSVVGQVRLGRVPYLHSFGLTARHAVLIGHPFDVSATKLLWSNKGFIDHFAWHPAEGTRLWLVDRATKSVREHLAPTGFVFHVVNAFEDGADTVIDVALFPDAGIVERLTIAACLKDGLPDLTPSIVRWRLTPGREAAVVEQLLGDGFEFPAIAYRQVSGKRHTVAWGARITGGGARSELVRLDEGGQTRTFSEPGVVLGEPVLVESPTASREDDGVLLSVGAATSGDRSVLVVLDASSMEPLAQAEVPLPIPLGFHGTFFAAPGESQTRP